MTGPPLADPQADPLAIAEAQAQPLRRGHIGKTLFRLGLSIAALVVATFVLIPVYSDLDLGSIKSAIGSLDDAEWIALIAVWVLVIWFNGFLTASVVPKLPVRRGVTAYLASSAISSSFPGRGDLAMRLVMYRSWGYSSTVSTVSVAASGMVTVGTKLVLPAIAAVALLLSGELTGDTARFALIGMIVAVVAIATMVLALLRPAFAARVGGRLERMIGAVLRRVGRPGPQGLGDRLVEARGESIHLLGPRWYMALFATTLLRSLGSRSCCWRSGSSASRRRRSASRRSSPRMPWWSC